MKLTYDKLISYWPLKGDGFVLQPDMVWGGEAVEYLIDGLAVRHLHANGEKIKRGE